MSPHCHHQVKSRCWKRSSTPEGEASLQHYATGKLSASGLAAALLQANQAPG